jgi:hypothetical protein
LLTRLERVGEPSKVNSIGSTQLRLEGIDALELHFAGSHQPLSLASEARDFLTGQLDLNPVSNAPPNQLRVMPPVERDGTPGFILSRSLDPNGRPVAFAFSGAPPEFDGSEVQLDVALLEQSLNFTSVAAGHAHPLFYDTLFVDLRNALAGAAVAAREQQLGLWRSDRSHAGLHVTGQADLERDGVVFPKLFRRLTEFLAQPQQAVSGFLPWLAETREQVLDVSTNNFTHFDNVVAVDGDTIRLTRRPEELVFVSAKTDSAVFAPWLIV